MTKYPDRRVSRLYLLIPYFSTFLFIISVFIIETTTHHNYPDNMYSCHPDSNTVYSSDKNTNIVISRLRHDVAIMSEWFYENGMVLNTVKCYFLTVGFNPFHATGLFGDPLKTWKHQKTRGFFFFFQRYYNRKCYRGICW